MGALSAPTMHGQHQADSPQQPTTMQSWVLAVSAPGALGEMVVPVPVLVPPPMEMHGTKSLPAGDGRPLQRAVPVDRRNSETLQMIGDTLQYLHRLSPDVHQQVLASASP